jgi:hypothetical protein
MKLGSSKVKCGTRNRMSSCKVIDGINGMGCKKLGNSRVKHSMKHSI